MESSDSTSPPAKLRNASGHPLFDGLPPQWTLANHIDLTRHVGVRAIHAAMLAKARRLELASDPVAAAATYRELAHAIWASGVDYGEALRCGRRALELEPNDATRFTLANWLERVGEHRASAEMLEGLSHEAMGQDVCGIHARMGSLYLRARDAAAAGIHFAELARTDPNATSALIAIATMAGWAPEQITRERGVVAWHEAARRFKRDGELLQAFEATHRAFELDPASSLAAERLAQELELMRRSEAADEVWRQSANAAGDTTRHEIRAVSALEAGDLLRALAALLDARGDTVFDPDDLVSGVDHLLSPQRGLSRGFDRILAELGCADWLAVRLEAGPLFERWPDEAGCHVALGRLETAYFAHQDAAREAIVRAVIAQPNHPEACARLADWTGSDAHPDPLLRAIVQAARVSKAGLGCRQIAQAIVDRGREDADGANLQLWALEQLRLTGHLTEELRAEHAKKTDQAASQRKEGELQQAELRNLAPEERRLALKHLERRLALDPYAAVEHLLVVQALVECDAQDPQTQSLYIELLDVVARQVVVPSQNERLANAVAEVPRLLGERGMVAQAKFHLRHGQVEAALCALLPLLDSKQTSVRGLLWLFTLARRFRNALVSARALERIAEAFRPQIRSVLACLAADLYVEAGDATNALRLIADIPRTIQNLPRLVLLELHLAEHGEAALAWESMEHALSKVLPNATIYAALARAHQLDGEFELALAWIHRALALRPFDITLHNEQLELALRVGDAARVREILRDLMRLALPSSEWVEGAASALGWMTSAELVRAGELAKQLLEFIGPGSPSLRAAMLDTARATNDDVLALEVLERAAAVAADPAPIYLALAERRWIRGEIESGMVDALRAAQSGAPADTWVNYVWVSTTELAADAQLTQLELVRLMHIEAPDDRARLDSLRRLAVARFDLAQDTDGAVQAWHELAVHSQGQMWPQVARDMGDVLGNRAAVLRLVGESKAVESEPYRAQLLGLAAQLAFEAGDSADALRYVEEAQLASTAAVALLPYAERIAAASNLPDRLDLLYSAIESNLFGVFAERSLHFRAAQAFANISEWSPALKHALLAHETRPEDTSTWKALVAISRRAGQPQAIAVSAMRVAEASRDRNQSHQWLDRAYAELGDSPEELRLRFDLSIRMLVGVPQVRGVLRVADCFRRMQVLAFEEIDFLRMRLERALESLMDDLEGPDGARLGIAMARVAAQLLARNDLAARALFSAIKADADIEEYGVGTADLAWSVAADREAWGPVFERILDWMERPYVGIGRDAVKLICELAAELGTVIGVSRVEAVARTHEASDSWLRTWQLGEGLARLFVGRDGRTSALTLAAAWAGTGSPLDALGLLNRAAELHRNASPSDPERRRLDATWHWFQEQYGLVLSELAIPEHLEWARAQLQTLEPMVPPEVVATLRVALERRSDDRGALSLALAEQAFMGVGSSTSRVDWLVEAAEIAENLGDLDGATVYYRAALGLQRTSVAARLGLGSLMVRLGRHQNKEQAQLLLEIATGLEPGLPPAQRDVAVFLQAEALDALGRDNEAHRLLEEAEERIGPRPLIVLGLAEHAYRLNKSALALGYFAAALGGNLLGLRSPASVSLQAAHASAAAGNVALALQWLQPSLLDAVTRPDALVLEAELQGASDVDSQFETTDIEASRGDPPPRLLESNDASPAVASTDEGDPGTRRNDVDHVEQPFDSKVVRTSQAEPFEAAMARPPSAEAPVETLESATMVSHQAMDLMAPDTPSTLEHALYVGELLRPNPEQLRAWLPEGKRCLRKWPLSLRLLELVREAASIESHVTHVAALGQVIGVLRGDDELPQPGELGRGTIDIDTVRNMLMRELNSRESEALTLVWDGAEHEFLKEASDYDITGVMRVVGAASAVARLASELVRHFGIPRAPLFFRRANRPLVSRVVLLNPVAALLDGELPADERALAYRVGSALWATIPEHSLLFGMERERVDIVLRALSLAFGSTGHQPDATLGEPLRLAQVLWQTVTSRSQRRLKEICVSEFDVGRALDAAHQSLRRAGLYACGDLRVALTMTCHELLVDPHLVREQRWPELCQTVPELIDLFQVASSAEFADARWLSLSRRGHREEVG